MNDDSDLVTIETDEFLTDTLHYVLGSFSLNQGDGHTWVIKRDFIQEARLEIIERFSKALGELIDKSLE